MTDSSPNFRVWDPNDSTEIDGRMIAASDFEDAAHQYAEKDRDALTDGIEEWHLSARNLETGTVAHMCVHAEIEVTYHASVLDEDGDDSSAWEQSEFEAD